MEILKLYFEVKEYHLKLLKRFYVSYNGSCEFGAPCIDPKRPFGNGDVYDDMREIVGDEFKGYSKKQLYNIYRELETCLQILVRNLSITTGLYQHSMCLTDWEKI